MPRFFTGTVDGVSAVISGEDARHIALSLRMKAGEGLTVCDGQGTDYQCRIVSVTPEEIVLDVVEAASSAGEPGVFITLYQALPKGDKFETIVQKAVELGVGEIVPVVSRRCVSRPDSKTLAKKRERWQRIAAEAAKQCGRGRVPVIGETVDFTEAVKRMHTEELAILLYENADTPLRETLGERLRRRVAVLVGSEGGFEPAEAELAREHGLACLSLGSRILRCETAPLAALSAILYQAGEF